MNCAGIIVELNPFHNGHFCHIKETREKTGCKYVIAVMSGNFVQRGEPAVCNKWLRTKMALMYGVDVVVEIPVQYVISGTDYFARGSVALLDAMGVVSTLCFGSESGNINEIKSAGQVLANEPIQYKNVLRSGLDMGLSFAAARGRALEACLTNEFTNGLFTMPNNGLAIEYCKAVKLFGSPMEVFTTHRQSGGPSATKIRQKILKNQMHEAEADMPGGVVNILREVNKFACLDDYSDSLRYMLYRGSSVVDSLGEGLGNRFRKMCGEHSKITDLLSAVKTKRYTYTRLQRAVLRILMDISDDDVADIQYIRVLGFRKEAAGLVGEITRKAKLPVVTHRAEMGRLLQGHEGRVAAKMLSQELMAGDVYRLASAERGGYRSEYGAGIVVV